MVNAAWQKYEEIFPLVADLPEAEREARLRELCADDAALCREIRALLKADEKAAGFIESPIALPDSLSQVFRHAQTENPITATAREGRQFGTYRVLQKLGAGGMGAVYLAERADGEFSKKVAIKIVRNDADTDFNLRRFRHERQILAALEHQNIARLLDGGTTEDGLPYLVMEYVEGETLFDFCNSRDLNLHERLQLFRQICQAIEYAHERRIIHRDIKPGNILVTDGGAVKLLDFGIAKILDADFVGEAVEQTATLMRQMTPEYASPEQIKGEEITPATDVYSLGVVLYELLTGERPYKFTSRAPHEIARVICEQEIRSPEINTESPLSDDLKYIVLKSLQKKPSERYIAVADFDRDIAGFLDGLPILDEDARLEFSKKSDLTDERLEETKMMLKSPTTADGSSQTTGEIQKPRKLKIKWATAAAMAITVLSFSLYYHFVGFRVYTVKLPQQAPAATEAQKSGDAKSALSGDAVANELYQAGKQQLATRTPDGIKKGIEFFNEAAGRDTNFAAAFSGLADAHILLASVPENSVAANYRKAEEYAVKALALDPDLAEARVSLGMAKFRNSGDIAAAEKHFQRAIEINPQLATAHHWYSVVLSNAKRFDDALREARLAVELEPRSAVIQTNLAGLYKYAKRYDEAIFHYDRAIETDNGFVAAYFWKSLVEQYQGKYDAAIDTYRKARIHSGGDENEPLWVLMHAQAHAVAGRRDEAMEVLNRYFQGAAYRKQPAAFVHEVALVHNLLGDTETAFDWLNKVKIEEAKQAEIISNDPRFDNLRADPRFMKLAEKWLRDGKAQSKKK